MPPKRPIDPPVRPHNATTKQGWNTSFYLSQLRQAQDDYEKLLQQNMPPEAYAKYRSFEEESQTRDLTAFLSAGQERDASFFREFSLA